MTDLTLPHAELSRVVADHPHPLLFATVSGAHLYGFPSVDSDVDLRGAHLLPVAALVGIGRPVETVSRMWVQSGVEMDLVTHDLRKFARLLVRPNGYVLEQLLSPLVVHSTPEHAELVELAPGLVTAGHAGHYRGFAVTQRRLFERTGQLKPLLYTFRVLLTGIHLMRAGELCAHLPTLATAHPVPDYLSDLMAAKRGGEHRLLAELPDAPSAARLVADIDALHARLDAAAAATRLPAAPPAAPAVDALIVRVKRVWSSSRRPAWHG
jgi:predicted nucleotidyltransferase